MHQKKGVNALQLLAGGFAAIILIGAFLLWLPFSTYNGISFFDALFTATSATCVTGLVVCDTATTFTPIGQVIIILLIQTGGLGFMTIIGWLLMVLGRKIGLRERTFLVESVSSLQLGGVMRLTKRILICTAICEGAGAILLASRFIPLYGWGRGIWYGVFHSISAFCNAGFDLLGFIEPYCSLTPFATDYVVNITIMLLILIGGFGFIVWDDIIDNGFRFKKYRIHSKIVLVASATLVFGGAFIFGLVEWNNTLAEFTLPQKALNSFFHSVTPRTAGFNTIDLAALTPAAKTLTNLLMLVGGGAGSTAGGMKITTVTVIILASVAYARRCEDTEAFGKRVPQAVVRRAYSSALVYVLILFIGTFVLSLQGLAYDDILLEVFSAIGTVGLSTGITRELNSVSRAVIILMMYCGRIGSLSVAMMTTKRTTIQATRLPEGKIIAG